MIAPERCLVGSPLLVRIDCLPLNPAQVPVYTKRHTIWRSIILILLFMHMGDRQFTFVPAGRRRRYCETNFLQDMTEDRRIGLLPCSAAVTGREDLVHVPRARSDVQRHIRLL